MRAIILAAGRGSRMGALTDAKPKCLLSINGKTLLERQIDALKKAGISEIAIVTGYKSELLRPFAKTTFHNNRWACTQMVSSLEMAQEWLADEDCIVSYSDIFYDSSAPEILINTSQLLAITFDPNWQKLWEKRFKDPLVDAETFAIDENNSILEIGGVAKSMAEIQGQYMGLIKFSPKAWEELLDIRRNISIEQRDRMHMTDAIQRIISNGNISVFGVPYEGNWGELDSISDLSLYRADT